jgi:hypothetical protein
MAWSTSSITNVRVERLGADLLLSWSSSAPAGTTHQVYLDGRLAWAGESTRIVIPTPVDLTTIAVGTVGAGEAYQEFISDAATGQPNRRAKITWEGGTFLSESIQAFRVYQGTTPGGAVSYTTPVATVQAYAGGIVNDGFGLGWFGGGGFGRAPSSYEWQSPPLAAGTWNFGVKAVDDAGIEGTAVTSSVVIAAPPLPPSGLAKASYNSTTRVAVLTFAAGA